MCSMTDRIRIRELSRVDAFAMRVGGDALVHVSSTVPSWARPAAADHLLALVHSAPGAHAAASLALGAAIGLAAPSVIRSRWPAIGMTSVIQMAAGTIAAMVLGEA